MTDPLLAWSRTPGGSKVLAEARRRLEAGSKLAGGSLHVELSAADRRDVGALLGVGWEASAREVPVRALTAALAERGTSLRQLLEAEAPLRDRPAERDAVRVAAEGERARAIAGLTGVGVSAEVASWVLARPGLPRPGSGALVPVAEAAAKVWQKAPGGDRTPVMLAQLASDLFDDPHALDRKTDVGRTVARIAAAEAAGDTQFATVVTMAQWRAAWATIGITCDAVSSLVLVLNLDLAGSSPAAAITAVHGEPVWLTLRSLRGDWRATHPQVWVCENPSIVEAAADRLGVSCPPLVCTFGKPSTAAIELLRRLAANGVAVHVRADDDGAGQGIVAQLRHVAPHAELWRYELRGTRAANETPRYEEDLMDLLLADLAG